MKSLNQLLATQLLMPSSLVHNLTMLRGIVEISAKINSPTIVGNPCLRMKDVIAPVIPAEWWKSIGPSKSLDTNAKKTKSQRKYEIK